MNIYIEDNGCEKRVKYTGLIPVTQNYITKNNKKKIVDRLGLISV